MFRELTIFFIPQTNCWFFVSLIQQHLGIIGDGSFAFGELKFPSVNLELRNSISREGMVCAYTMLPVGDDNSVLVKLVQISPAR